jgi:signal transduction histidine kinase
MISTKSRLSWQVIQNGSTWKRVLKIAGLTLIVVALSAGLIVGIAAAWLQPPSKDLRDLFLFLLLSGGISAALSVLWLQWSQHGTHLHTQLVVTYLIGVLIALINVAVTSGLMFLSIHDLSLVTLLIIFSAAISVFFAFLVSQKLVQSVLVLCKAAQQVAAGNLDTRVTVGGSRELTELGDIFNNMTAQLGNARNRQQELEKMRVQLVASISHDLRTPLASLRLLTEAVSDGIADEQTTKVFLGRMRNEIEYINGLIEDLFELSQLDAGTLKLKPERNSLHDLISDTLGSLSNLTLEKHQHLEGQVAENLPDLSFDLRKIQRVLNNLVTNAIRYTHEGSHILITAQTQDNWAIVSVHDDGEGIPDDILGRVFEPFYRGEQSRGRESGGVGLGLAIAKGLVEAHGGKISVESQPKHGTTFSFSLPLATRTQA